MNETMDELRTIETLRRVIGSIGGRGVRVDIMDSY